MYLKFTLLSSIFWAIEEKTSVVKSKIEVIVDFMVVNLY
jgi:hypothetical protein